MLQPIRISISVLYTDYASPGPSQRSSVPAFSHLTVGRSRLAQSTRCDILDHYTRNNVSPVGAPFRSDRATVVCRRVLLQSTPTGRARPTPDASTRQLLVAPPPAAGRPDPARASPARDVTRPGGGRANGRLHGRTVTVTANTPPPQQTSSRGYGEYNKANKNVTARVNTSTLRAHLATTNLDNVSRPQRTFTHSRDDSHSGRRANTLT